MGLAFTGKWLPMSYDPHLVLLCPSQVWLRRKALLFPHLQQWSVFCASFPRTDSANNEQWNVWDLDRSNLTISNLIWLTAALMWWLGNSDILIQFWIPHTFSDCMVEPVTGKYSFWFLPFLIHIVNPQHNFFRSLFSLRWIVEFIWK